MTFTILHGKNLDILPTLPDNSVNSIVTDPPYELNFMGKKWDSSGIAYSVELWTECLRVLKPGGHLLSFGGTRTFHRVAVAIEDAGFEIRDNIAWLYGSGFPKSHNLKGEFAGFGTALKPAHEPIIVARKPLEGTVAHNVLTSGTGALNIDGSRIGAEGGTKGAGAGAGAGARVYGDRLNGERGLAVDGLGRWPANIILDEHTAGLLDEQSDASRFFYVAKASKRDRNEGLEELPFIKGGSLSGGEDKRSQTTNQPSRQNFHPTVKPTSLMEYLVKLVTPPNGTVLDPFTGSGSTGKAAILNGFDFIGIEMTEDYLPIIKARLKHAEATYGSQIRVD